jgi:DNA-binding PucR family transcriptional regulator
LPPATHAACGRVLSGHDGFRSAHRQAEAAARFMTARNRGRVSNFADVALASLLEQNREAADEFIRDELGPLAEDTEDMRTLRRTVARYLAEHRSPRRAAAGLYVNRNTIIYRIRKAEKLLGRPVEERRLELETALLLMDGRDGNAASSLASGPRTGPTGQ